MNVNEIRQRFVDEYKRKNFLTDRTGCKFIEIISANFIADEPYIFGEPNYDYIKREIEWYESKSLNVNDIPGGPPKIWQSVADKHGNINSNYGWCIYSKENGEQYVNCLVELVKNPDSRRAVMIYNRPNMWTAYNSNGMNDFMCTYAVQYFIRYEKLIASVYMRSNDAWAGYRNDYAWQKHVLNKLADELEIEPGHIIWNAGNIHLYDRQFYLISHYGNTSETHITKEDYEKLYNK